MGAPDSEAADRWLAQAEVSLAESLREDGRHARGGEVREVGGLLLCRGAGRLPMAPNAAMRLDDTVPAEAALDTMAQYYGERGAGFTLQLRLGDRQDDLAAAAAGRGPLAVSDAAALVLPHPVEPPPSALDLRAVRDESDVAAYAAVVDDAYQSLGWPPGTPSAVFAAPSLLLHPEKAAFVVREDGAAVAAAYVQVAAGMGMVSWVGTVAGARGRGLGDAVTRAAANAAFAMGADAAWLVASPMGEPLYRRLGFHELARSRSYVLWPGLGTEGTVAGGGVGRPPPPGEE